MSRFTRFTLVTIAIAFALSGCGNATIDEHQPDPAQTPMFGETAASHGYPNSVSLCGEQHYPEEEMREVRIGNKCAALYKDNDPTTERNHTVYQYMISPERRAVLHTAYVKAASALLDKMLSGEIPYKLHGDVDVDSAGNVHYDSNKVAIFKPAPHDGWATIESDFSQPSRNVYAGSSARVTMEVRVTNGKVDTSIEPLRFSFNSRRGMIDMNGAFVLDKNDVLIPDTAQAFSWGHYMMGVDESHVFSISLIDYVDPKGMPYLRQLTPNDIDITVVAEPVYDPTTKMYKEGWTPDDIRNQDADFIDILNREVQLVNGSDWAE